MGNRIRCYAYPVNLRLRIRQFSASGVLLLFCLSACHKEEQAVAGVAKNAVSAQQKAQAFATRLDQERAQLDRIPLPTKSMYIDVREPANWANPFLSVDADSIDLRVIMADANPSLVGQGSMMRPEAARRQEIQDLAAEKYSWTKVAAITIQTYANLLREEKNDATFSLNSHSSLQR